MLEISAPSTIHRVSLIVPTYNAGHAWADFILALHSQTLSLEDESGVKCTVSIDVTIIDSSSTDDTAVLSRAAGFEVLVIDKQSFDHGGTRQFAFEHILKKSKLDLIDLAYQWVVFMTQDAILSDPSSLAQLLSGFKNEQVGACYGRQLPHPAASLLSAHARRFNYPEVSSLKSMADKETLGIKTAFCSNSFAAYRVDVLAQIGGFPKRVILGEDMWVAAKMLHEGYSVAYVSEACVYHSHNYTYLEDFRRYFDTGVFHAEESWILKTFGVPTGEGKRYVLSELGLLKNQPWMQRVQLLFEISIRTSLKLLGYHLGKQHAHIPMLLKRRMGLFKAYWIK
jgi:rhamnosyltransferase